MNVCGVGGGVRQVVLLARSMLMLNPHLTVVYRQPMLIHLLAFQCALRRRRDETSRCEQKENTKKRNERPSVVWSVLPEADSKTRQNIDDEIPPR